MYNSFKSQQFLKASLLLSWLFYSLLVAFSPFGDDLNFWRSHLKKACAINQCCWASFLEFLLQFSYAECFSIMLSKCIPDLVFCLLCRICYTSQTRPDEVNACSSVEVSAVMKVYTRWGLGFHFLSTGQIICIVYMKERCPFLVPHWH